MTHEEKKAHREHIQHHAKGLMERLERACQEPMGWEEMVWAARILKSLSSVDKNIAKTHYYECEHPHHEDKKY